MTRNTKESKDVEAPRHNKNRAASVSSSAGGDRRSVDSDVEDDRPFFFYFDANDESRQGT